MGLKNVVYRMIGKKIAKKLELKEGSPMENKKPWYQSKAVLAGIVTVLIGTYESTRLTLAPQLGWELPEIPPFVYTVLGAIGIYGRVSANTKVG